MCGFLTVSREFFSDQFDAALDTLASRGPDERGVHQSSDIWIGHRRLSVIDLAGGHQPMRSPDGRFVIAYNGEIYNASTLRAELIAQGVTFQTDHSDTEVLLLGYQHWGAKTLLPKLDGMFAFVVYDQQEQGCFAARDRFGIKPFFYSTHQGLITASTLAPFWKLPGFPLRLNPHALREYLATHAIPAPQTILRDVHALPPGCSLRWSERTGQAQIEPFWEVPHAQDLPEVDPDAWVDHVDEVLYESVCRQLEADVPLGVFLSGGIDSSLMVHYIHRARRSSAARAPIKTFNLAFHHRQDKYDESPYARMVAEHFGTEHTQLSAREMTQAFWLESIGDLDQPFADPAYLPLRQLCGMMRDHVTVAVAGDGGDELFCGYPRYLKNESQFPPTPVTRLAALLARLRALPAPLQRRALYGKERLRYNHAMLGNYPGTRKDMAAFLSPDFVQRVQPEDAQQHWLEFAASFADPIDTDALMRADLQTYLTHGFLTKTDRASMCFGLEVRVPMLGNSVSDLVLRHRLGGHGAEGASLKPVLKRLAQRHLPRPVWDRKKHGFSVPLHDFMTQEWREACADLVARCDTIAPFMDAGEIRRRYQRMAAGHQGASRVMYAVFSLLGWLDQHPVDVG